MPKENPTPNASMAQPQPLPVGETEPTDKAQAMPDGRPGDETAVAPAQDGMDGMFERMAGLYSLASMLVGEGEDSIRLVEMAVSTAEASAGYRSSRVALATAAVELIANRNTESLAAPERLEPAVTCIDDDDLDAAAEARDAMERMIAGPDRDRVRAWLESLPTALRTIYVLRAVAELTTAQTADLLGAHGGPLAAEWTPDQVRELFRQGLCSLASQLIHATTRD